MDAIREVSMAELGSRAQAGDKEAKAERKRRLAFRRFWPKKRLTQKRIIEKAFQCLKEDPQIAAVLKARDGSPLDDLSEEAQDDWGSEWVWMFGSVEYEAATCLVDWSPNASPDEVFKEISPNFELKTKNEKREVLKIITACCDYWKKLEWGKPLRAMK
jgi:hypothetical protein